MSLVYGKTGEALRLGPEIARGGEGVVYSIAGVNDRVAKVYLKAPTERKIAKLRAMTATPADGLAKIAAWPLDIVNEGGKVKGFVMPRLGGHEDVHELYSPKSRANSFPEADFRFITHVASNVARAFAQVHAAGYVIGDVNHAHLLVAKDARVALIDCDSFQVKAAGQTLTCDVGQGLFTPPELQGAPTFTNLERTPNHDLFGLAVVLFHLLFMGRHPFSGVWNGPGDMPIERAIREYRFAYGAGATPIGMKQPPATVSLSAFPPEIVLLFERAFGRGGQRPTAADWISPLKVLEASLQQCSAVAAHHYPNNNRACPWCEVEKQSGIRMFGQRLVAAPGQQAVDLAALWRTIDQITPPSSDPPLPSAQPWIRPPGAPTSAPKYMRIVLGLTFAAIGVVGCTASSGGVFLGILGLGACWLIWPKPPEAKVRAARVAVDQARSMWQQLEARWRREAALEAFVTLKAELLSARNELMGLPAKRAQAMAKLQRDREAHQKQLYLDRFTIKKAKISGIGPSRAVTLASFGIETAADVDYYKIIHIHGFGPALCSALVEWRRKHEANFRFNANAPVDPREIARIDNELNNRRVHLVRLMQQGPLKLNHTKQAIEGARLRLGPVMKQTWDAYQLAQAHQDAL